MSPLLLAALAAVAIGACVQATVGFGLALLAAPLLALVDPVYVPGPMLVAGLTLSILVVVRDRRSVSVHDVGWAVVGRLPGSLLGAAALAVVSRDALALMLGGMVLLAVALSVSGLDLAVTRRSLLGAGAISGFTATTTSVGGPPMALLFQRSRGQHVRANLAGFFILGAGISLATLAAAGEFGAAELHASAILVPGVGLGFLASTWTRGLVDGERVRPAVLAVAAASALALIVRTLVG